MTKLLSIIIPSYNMETYLNKTLESLCVQDEALFNRLDVLVVNDGSKDATSQIAHEFATRHPSVFRVIDKPNGHYGSCVNRALPEATGEFVKILDADDSYDTTELEKFLRELDRLRTLSPAVDLVLTHVRNVSPAGETLEALEYPFNGRDDLTLDDLTNLKSGRFIHGYTYRRAIFDGLDYHQSEGVAYTDTEWIFLPATRVRRIAHCPLFVYRYLIGRDDQSCNFQTLGRQLKQIRQSFDVRFDQYRRLKTTWSPAAIRYAERELASSIVYLYVTYAQYGCRNFRAELKSLDRTVATDLASLRDRFAGLNVLFPGKPYAIDYGKLCASHPLSRPLLSLALRLKQRLAR